MNSQAGSLSYHLREKGSLKVVPGRALLGSRMAIQGHSKIGLCVCQSYIHRRSLRTCFQKILDLQRVRLKPHPLAQSLHTPAP